MARANAFHMQSGSERSLPNALNGAFMQRSVAHDAAAADIFAFELKLRLDQDQVLRTGTGGRDYRGKHLGDGDKRYIYGHEIRGLRNLFRPQITSVGLDLRDACVLLQPPGHLLRRHVDRINMSRAVLQQAIREASRGRPHINANFPGHFDPEIFQRSLQLQTSAAGIFC